MLATRPPRRLPAPGPPRPATQAVRRPRRQHPVLAELPVAAFFIVAAIYATWPIGRHLATGVTGTLTDPLENAWVLGWEAHALLHQPLRMFSANIFAPQQITLAYTENLLGLSVFLAPIFWITHNALLEVNVATILVYAIGGFTTYLLVNDLTHRRGPAVVAGLVFTVAPVRLLLVQHIVVNAMYLLPLVFLPLVRLGRHASGERPAKTRRLAIALGAVLAFQMWTSINGGVMALTAVAVWGVWEAYRLRADAGRALMPALGGLALGLVLSIPVLVPYALLHRIHPEFQHSLAEVLSYSSAPTYYLSPPAFIGAPFVRAAQRFLVARWGSSGIDGTHVKAGLFPGFFLSAAFVGSLLWAAYAAIRARLRRRALPRWVVQVGLFSVIGLSGFILSLGPRNYRSPRGAPLPFDIFLKLIPAGGIRVPYRFALLVIFGMSVAVGVAIAAARPVVRRVLVGVAILAIGLETMPTTYHLVHAPPITAVNRMVAQTSGIVLALPATDIDAAGNPTYAYRDNNVVLNEFTQMYLSTANFRPMINGIGSIVPQFYVDQMKKIQDFPSPGSMATVKAWGVRTVMVELSLLPGTHWQDAPAKLDAYPGVRLLAGDSHARVYDISAAG